MKLESQVERGVGRLEPERDDLPISVFVVLDEMGIPVFCAAYPQACRDHISDAIVEHEIHSAGLWVVREYTLDPRTRSQKLADAGFTRRPSLRAMDMREALELIAAPMRPDGTWNRDRTACQQLAAEALGRYDDDQPCDVANEADLWRCTVCGRIGTVGRCCGEDTRNPVRAPNAEITGCAAVRVD